MTWERIGRLVDCDGEIIASLPGVEAFVRHHVRIMKE